MVALLRVDISGAMVALLTLYRFWFLGGRGEGEGEGNEEDIFRIVVYLKKWSNSYEG